MYNFGLETTPKSTAAGVSLGTPLGELTALPKTPTLLAGGMHGRVSQSLCRPILSSHSIVLIILKLSHGNQRTTVFHRPTSPALGSVMQYYFAFLLYRNPITRDISVIIIKTKTGFSFSSL